MNWTKLIKEVDYYNTINTKTLYTNNKEIDVDNFIIKQVTKKSTIPNDAIALIEFIDEDFNDVTTRIFKEADTVVVLTKMSLFYKFNNIYRNNILNSLKLIISMPFEYTDDETKLTHNYYYFIFKVKKEKTINNG